MLFNRMLAIAEQAVSDHAQQGGELDRIDGITGIPEIRNPIRLIL
jgi:hypothetical protein